MIPNRSELKRFGNEHPFVSLLLATMIGFTAVDVMSSFTLPKGKGPFATRSGAMPAVVSSVTDLGSTSTSTSTSSSHPPHIVRERLIQHGTYGQLNGVSNLSGSTSTSTSTSSTHLPPSMRRRMMARTLETEVSGSHLGKQVLSEVDDTQTTGLSGYNSMFSLDGLIPETGNGWTE